MRQNEFGRSMIEMLGVLAIIGVLSVGGLAGYAKAMAKYRINKTVDQITNIVMNVRSAYGSQRNYKGLHNDIVRKAHLAPDEMLKIRDDDDLSALTDAYGHDVWILSSDFCGMHSSHDYKAFYVDIINVFSEEECIQLVTQDWEDSGLIFIAVVNGGQGDVDLLEGDVYLGCKGGIQGQSTIACPGGKNIPVPMPLSIATNACQKNSELFFKFY